MRPRSTFLLTVAATLCAGAAALPAAARAGEAGACELSRADRRTTPSHACMSCHDGSAGTGVAFQMRRDAAGMSHPVSVDYRAAEAAHPGRYRPAGALPPEVPLVRGKVECTSCHDGASPDPRRVVAIRDLCVACHAL